MPIKNIVTGQRVTKEKLQRAKELRREMTPAEKLLWHEVRAKKLGVHFRRQQIIQGFIVDFYCHRAALVVEVDGDIYDLQKEEDERRERVLSAMGLRVVRFGNDEVVRRGAVRGGGEDQRSDCFGSIRKVCKRVKYRLDMSKGVHDGNSTLQV